MKNIFKYFFVGALLLGFASCEEDDGDENITVAVQDAVERGAVLRTIEITQNEVNNEDLEGGLSFTIEEQDVEGGDLLDVVNVYVTYNDNSDGFGDSSNAIEGQEILYQTITAAEFTDGPFGLPRFTITISTEQFLDLTNSTLETIFGRDTFVTRLELVLTDGRVFSSDNAGGIITGGFFNSPFQYVTNIISPIAADAFVGDYMIVNDSAGVLGFNVFEEGGTVTLAQPSGGSSVDRAFDYVYLPDAGVGQAAVPFTMSFVVDSVVIPAGQPTGLQCSSGLRVGPAPDESFGMFDLVDDSSFTIRFTDNYGDGEDPTAVQDCGEAPKTVQATLTKL